MKHLMIQFETSNYKVAAGEQFLKLDTVVFAYTSCAKKKKKIPPVMCRNLNTIVFGYTKCNS